MQTDQPSFECVVCLTKYNESQGTYSFSCCHPLCDACSRELSQRGDHRCPTCRSPRETDYVHRIAPLRTVMQEVQNTDDNTTSARRMAEVANFLMNRLHTTTPEMFRDIMTTASRDNSR